jgi:GGDEF domain-containing protein
MLRLNRYILALVLWLSFLFNIERLDLDIGNPDLSNIASPVYVVVIIMVVLGILLPQWKQVPLWRVHIIAALSFGVALFVDGRPTWGDQYTYISLFGLTATLVSVTLAYVVGRLSADFVETVRALLFSEMDGQVFGTGQADNVIRREMQYSRRTNRPLSVMLVDAKHSGREVNMQATAQEVQRLLAKRHNLVALTRLIARTLRRTDFILDQTDEGRLVLVMPELRKEQAEAITKRLSERARHRLGLTLHWGMASFPDNGVTFEELIYQAEQAIQPNMYERRSDDGLVEQATDKLAIVETPATISIRADR